MSLGFTITSPRQSVCQCSGNILQRLPVTPSSRKVMITVFWDHEGILLTAFQPQGQTVNADSCCNILRKLHKAIQRKWPGLTGPGKSPPGSDSSPKNFILLVFRGLWNDGTSASMYREVMLKNRSIFQISTLVCLSSISICNLLIDWPTYYPCYNMQPQHIMWTISNTADGRKPGNNLQPQFAQVPPLLIYCYTLNHRITEYACCQRWKIVLR
jgi:hypothetical protein